MFNFFIKIPTFKIKIIFLFLKIQCKEFQSQHSVINELKIKLNESRFDLNDLQEKYQNAKNYAIDLKEKTDKEIKLIMNEFERIRSKTKGL